MATPTITTVASGTTATGLGGTPRNFTLAIGEPTGGQHRALALWTVQGDDGDAIASVTAGGNAMTALGGGGAGTTIQLFPYVILDPVTDGSGNCSISCAFTGDGTYSLFYWWVVVDNLPAAAAWTDLTSGGAVSGNSTAPSSGSQTVPSGSLLVSGMYHNFSSSYTLDTSTGSVEHVHGISSSKPMSIASRSSSGTVQWNTSSSNGWYATAVLFNEAGAVSSTPPTILRGTQVGAFSSPVQQF